jgi:hypothetical protein
MTAAPDSRPVDERLKAAMDELHAASQEQDRAQLGAGGFRADAIERLQRTWDVLEVSDQRWDAIVALLALDNPTPIASSGNPAIVALHAELVRLLSALLTVDATVPESEWIHMHELKQAIDGLPALYHALEDELASSKVPA